LKPNFIFTVVCFFRYWNDKCVPTQ